MCQILVEGLNKFFPLLDARSSGYFALCGGDLYKFHPVVSDFSMLVSRFLIRKEEWALLGTKTGRFWCHLAESSAKISQACYRLPRLTLSAI